MLPRHQQLSRRSFLQSVPALALAVALGDGSHGASTPPPPAPPPPVQTSFLGDPMAVADANSIAFSTADGSFTMPLTTGVCPAACHVSAAGIVATGMIVDGNGNDTANPDFRPYERFEFGWDFGDAVAYGSNQEIIADANPYKPGVTYNANTDQVGPEASYVYRNAGIFQIALQVYGLTRFGGDRVLLATFYQKFTATAFTGMQYYFDSRAGYGNDANNGLTPTTPKQSVYAMQQIVGGARTKLQSNTRLNFAYGSTWTNCAQIIQVNGNVSNIQFCAYTNPNNPSTDLPVFAVTDMTFTGNTVAGNGIITGISDADFLAVVQTSYGGYINGPGFNTKKPGDIHSVQFNGANNNSVTVASATAPNATANGVVLTISPNSSGCLGGYPGTNGYMSGIVVQNMKFTKYGSIMDGGLTMFGASGTAVKPAQFHNILYDGCIGDNRQATIHGTAPGSANTLSVHGTYNETGVDTSQNGTMTLFWKCTCTAAVVTQRALFQGYISQAFDDGGKTTSGGGTPGWCLTVTTPPNGLDPNLYANGTGTIVQYLQLYTRASGQLFQGPDDLHWYLSESSVRSQLVGGSGAAGFAQPVTFFAQYGNGGSFGGGQSSWTRMVGVTITAHGEGNEYSHLANQEGGGMFHFLARWTQGLCLGPGGSSQLRIGTAPYGPNYVGGFHNIADCYIRDFPDIINGKIPAGQGDTPISFGSQSDWWPAGHYLVAAQDWNVGDKTIYVSSVGLSPLKCVDQYGVAFGGAGGSGFALFTLGASYDLNNKKYLGLITRVCKVPTGDTVGQLGITNESTRVGGAAFAGNAGDILYSNQSYDDQIVIERCTMGNATGGVSMMGTWRGTVRDCDIYNTGYEELGAYRADSNAPCFYRNRLYEDGSTRPGASQALIELYYADRNPPDEVLWPHEIVYNTFVDLRSTAQFIAFIFQMGADYNVDPTKSFPTPLPVRSRHGGKIVIDHNEYFAPNATKVDANNLPEAFNAYGAYGGYLSFAAYSAFGFDTNGLRHPVTDPLPAWAQNGLPALGDFTGS